MANKKVNKVGKEFDKVVDEMKKLAPKFAKADLNDKQKILKKLKELTAKKKDLKSQLERTVMDAEKDIELQIEIRKMLKTAVTKKLNEGKRSLKEAKSNIKTTWRNVQDLEADMQDWMSTLDAQQVQEVLDTLQNFVDNYEGEMDKDYLKAMK